MSQTVEIKKRPIKITLHLQNEPRNIYLNDFRFDYENGLLHYQPLFYQDWRNTPLSNIHTLLITPIK